MVKPFLDIAIPSRKVDKNQAVTQCFHPLLLASLFYSLLLQRVDRELSHGHNSTINKPVNKERVGQTLQLNNDLITFPLLKPCHLTCGHVRGQIETIDFETHGNIIHRRTLKFVH